MIPQTELHKALKVAADFVDDGKPGLHVVHFNFYNIDNFELVATDGRTLVIINLSVPHGIAGRFSIPLPMVEEVLKMFPAMPDTEVTLAAWEGQLMFTNGVATHMVRGADAEEYPPYREIVGRVIPAADPVYLDSRAVEGVVKICKPLRKKKSAKGDRFQCPAVRIITAGQDAAVGFRFDLDDELATITTLDAYIMPVTDVSL